MSVKIIDSLPRPLKPGDGWPWENPETAHMSPEDSISNWPRISIITPSYNQGKFIEKTIRSVFLQGYPNLEYIIMDGGSTDNSVHIIKQYQKQLTYWISEVDRGQVHAINKGFKMASGEILGFINSDDILMESALKKVSQIFNSDSRMRWVAGACHIFGSGYNEQIRDKLPQVVIPIVPINLSDLLNLKARTPQPAIFWHRKLWEEVGEFNESMQYCFDHEYWVRAFIKGFRIVETHNVLAGYRIHEESKTYSTWNNFMREFEEVAERYGEFASTEFEKKKIKIYWERRRFVSGLRNALIVGDRHGRIAAVKATMKLLNNYPHGVITRAFWGFLRRWIFGLWKN